jgi:hypothetical protein
LNSFFFILALCRLPAAAAPAAHSLVTHFAQFTSQQFFSVDEKKKGMREKAGRSEKEGDEASEKQSEVSPSFLRFFVLHVSDGSE